MVSGESSFFGEEESAGPAVLAPCEAAPNAAAEGSPSASPAISAHFKNDRLLNELRFIAAPCARGPSRSRIHRTEMSKPKFARRQAETTRRTGHPLRPTPGPTHEVGAAGRGRAGKPRNQIFQSSTESSSAAVAPDRVR